MIKRSVMLFICLVFLILAGGCETTKGVAVGIGATAQGAAKDAQGFWQAILKADSWMRKNLW